jgi:acetolactate synthase-1/2/3 large subunit
MGGSLPGSIGAIKANPDLDVIAVMGDGGFLMNVQELETAYRLGLSFTAIVFNDRTYSLIEKHQEDHNLSPKYIHFTNPDFDLLAKSFHSEYFYADEAKGFEEALKESRRSEGVKIIEVKIN